MTVGAALHKYRCTQPQNVHLCEYIHKYLCTFIYVNTYIYSQKIFLKFYTHLNLERINLRTIISLRFEKCR